MTTLTSRAQRRTGLHQRHCAHDQTPAARTTSAGAGAGTGAGAGASLSGSCPASPARRRRRSPSAGTCGAPRLLAAAAAALLLPLRARAQYLRNTALFNQTLAAGDATLVALLQNAPGLEDVFFPDKYRLPTDFYVYAPPDRAAEYTQNVIFQPCRQYDYACCSDTFGTPEYATTIANASRADYGTTYLTLDGGVAMDPAISRRPDAAYFIDETCTGQFQPPGRVDCVAARVASREYAVNPRCWNSPDDVIADAGCRSPADGSPLALCLELGFTQTAYVVECGGASQFNEHCGTFLEIHPPGFADMINEAKLRGTYTSGYRMTVISTTYKGDATRTLCWDPIKLGAYELWWVTRTLFIFSVERRIPFHVVSPLCDWDPVNNRYLPYATLLNPDGSRHATVLAGLDPFAAAKTLYTQPRTEGVPGFPGVGMGSTLVPVRGAGDAAPSYPATAVFDPATWHNSYTYTYTPDLADFTVRRGVLEPSLAQQAVIAALIAQRGYRALRADAGNATAQAAADALLSEAWAEAAALLE